MSSLLKYILAICLGAFIVSYLFFMFINLGLKNQKNDTFPVIRELVNSVENHQVIFVGSSLAKNNINPLVYDSINKVNSYNFGYPGAKIEHNLMIIKRYLQSNHPAPQKIFIVLEPYVLDSTTEINFPVQYYPYCNDSTIYNFVSKYDPDIKLVKYFPFIGVSKYNDYLKNLGIMGVLSPNRITSALIKGYEPLDAGSWKVDAEVARNKTKQIIPTNIKNHNEGLKHLEGICKACSEKNIQLVFVLPPVYHQKSTVNKTSPIAFVAELEPLITEYNILLIDHTQIELSFNKEFYFDWHHLNSRGAKIYTAILANETK